MQRFKTCVKCCRTADIDLYLAEMIQWRVVLYIRFVQVIDAGLEDAAKGIVNVHC